MHFYGTSMGRLIVYRTSPKPDFLSAGLAAALGCLPARLAALVSSGSDDRFRFFIGGFAGATLGCLPARFAALVSSGSDDRFDFLSAGFLAQLWVAFLRASPH